MARPILIGLNGNKFPIYLRNFLAQGVRCRRAHFHEKRRAAIE